MTPALLSLLLLTGLGTIDSPKEDLKHAGKEIGQGFKKGGLAVGHGARTAAKGTAKGAKETGHGIKEAVK